MIDHVSIGARDLAASAEFYKAVLAPLGYSALVELDDRVGFGKKYPELWVNSRPEMRPVADETGAHVCLRARSVEAVQAFHAAAMAGGGTSGGDPGERLAAFAKYYGAFIVDPDGNRIEAATFLS